MNKRSRKGARLIVTLEKLLIQLLDKLDISPTMYQRAIERYTSVASHLDEKGIDCTIYPQGSFALGTVVRPFRNDKDQAYDIDVVYLYNGNKSTLSPQGFFCSMSKTIEDYAIAHGVTFDEYDRCVTLTYADINEIGLEMDIVASVPEDADTINKIEQMGVASDKAKEAIAIAVKAVGTCQSRWCWSNPKGYKMWFDEINAPFANVTSLSERTRIFETNRTVYASIEQVPQQLERTSLQRVIQILKRHRDVFYNRCKCSDKKPTSAIITTLAARVAMKMPPYTPFIDLLNNVVSQLSSYENLTSDSYGYEYNNHKNDSLISKKEQKWELLNPVNPFDNYMDSWTNEHARLFFRWLKDLKGIFPTSQRLDTDTANEMLVRSSLGFSISNNSSVSNAASAYKVTTITPVKPWGRNV